MSPIQNIVVFLFLVLSLASLMVGFRESSTRQNPFGLAGIFNLIGAFVWGDAVILGLFWALASLVFLILQDWILFLLTLSLFWTVRSIGEIIYWLNQQFSPLSHKNPPENLVFNKFFPGDSIWFINQVYWQCLLVLSSIATLYLAKLWLT